MKILYTSEAVVEGGRAGQGRTSDGRLAVQLSVPKELAARVDLALIQRSFSRSGTPPVSNPGCCRWPKVGNSMLRTRRSLPKWESGPPVTAVLASRSRSTYMRRTFRVLTPKTS